VRLLLDTHIALWVIRDDPNLSDHARALITDAEEVFVSAASVWEIAIKHANDRARLSWIAISGTQALAKFREAGFELLAISPEHGAAVDRLPPLHGDPFDRILIAQAMTEPLVLVTRDRQIAAYGGAIVVV
jgi:PIN domain nuclease of toxin-antitoxin system